MNKTPEGLIQLNGENHLYFLNNKSLRLDSIATLFPIEIRSVHYFEDSTAILAAYNKGLLYFKKEKF
ncbi:MAG: hypothetical protein ACI86M_004050 [Saprospiraceae bacterium]|jgi:hypothetical protein